MSNLFIGFESDGSDDNNNDNDDDDINNNNSNENNNEKDKTDGKNDASDDNNDKGDEDPPQILVLSGSLIGLMKSGLLSHHLVDLSNFTLVRGEQNKQPVGKDNDG